LTPTTYFIGVEVAHTKKVGSKAVVNHQKCRSYLSAKYRLERVQISAIADFWTHFNPQGGAKLLNHYRGLTNL